MKQLVFVMALILAMAMYATAKPSGKSRELAKGLAIAVKSAQTGAVSNNGLYRKSSFLFNGKNVSAFYDAERDNLIGFSIPMSVADLPAETVQKIKTRFDKYSVQDAILFIRQNGYSETYISMSRPKKPTIVVMVNTSGKVHYFGREPMY